MAKITLNDGSILEGTIEELAELLEKVGGLNATNGDNFRKVEGREPRVGDYVKFFEDDLDITAGKYYEIIDVDVDGDFVFIDDGGDNPYAFIDYLGEDFEVFEKVGGEEPLKVGDYVVPLKSADDEYNITNMAMKLGEVVEELSGDYRDIRIEVVAHENDEVVGESFSVESKYFRKATDEEVAQAKQAKAEQKWAKIGRKPGEFKKGDIVRVIEDTGAHEAGEIVELAKDGAVEYLGNDGYAFGGEPEWFELIAPVESRVDLND